MSLSKDSKLCSQENKRTALEADVVGESSSAFSRKKSRQDNVLQVAGQDQEYITGDDSYDDGEETTKASDPKCYKQILALVEGNSQLTGFLSSVLRGSRKVKSVRGTLKRTKATLEANKKEHEKELATIKKEHQKELAANKKEHQKELAANKDEHEKELRLLKRELKEYDGILSSLACQYQICEDRVDEMNARHTKECNCGAYNEEDDVEDTKPEKDTKVVEESKPVDPSHLEEDLGAAKDIKSEKDNKAKDA